MFVVVNGVFVRWTEVDDLWLVQVVGDAATAANVQI